MHIILERIANCIEEKGLTPRAFSLSIGKHPSYFSNTAKQGSAPSVEVITLIIDAHPDFNINYIITGRGQKIINPDKVEESHIEYGKDVTFDSLIDKKISDSLEEYTKHLPDLMRDMAAVIKQIAENKV
jgi:hypothetical protein